MINYNDLNYRKNIIFIILNNDILDLKDFKKILLLKTQMNLLNIFLNNLLKNYNISYLYYYIIIIYNKKQKKI